MTQKKLLLVLIDGIGDVAIPDLGYKTPLQKSHTPWLNRLAGKTWFVDIYIHVLILPLIACGLNGLLDSVEPGLACGSDTAHMSILGYNPRQ